MALWGAARALAHQEVDLRGRQQIRVQLRPFRPFTSPPREGRPGAYEELMKGDSGLTRAERKMIAVVVSVANDCAYCMAAHSAALRKLTKDPALADAIAADYTTAPVDPRVRTMLAYAVKLTVAPTEMSEADVQGLRDGGWTDEDVMDIAEVTGMFDMSNRLASGLGWAPNPEYESLGRSGASASSRCRSK